MNITTIYTAALDTLIAAKLVDQATHFAGLATEARAAGSKDDAKYFQRAANANVKALEMWRAGLRPEVLGAGRYLLPSRTDGTPHLLTKDGDWTCTCAAGASDHWAKMILVAMEAVCDEQDAVASGDYETERVNALIASATDTPTDGPDGWELAIDGEGLAARRAASGFDPSRVADRQAAYAAMAEVFSN